MSMQVAAVGAALLAALQRERQASGADARAPDALAELLTRVASGAGGSAVASDMQQRLDVMFLGFLFLGVLVCKPWPSMRMWQPGLPACCGAQQCIWETLAIIHVACKPSLHVYPR